MGREVRLYYPGLTRDRYDRALAHVETTDAKGPDFWVNEEMLRRGGARLRIYPDTSAGSEALVEKARTRTFHSRADAEAARAADVAEAAAARDSLESFYVSEGWIDRGDPRGGLINEPGPIRETPARGLAGFVANIYSYTTAARLDRPWVQLGLSRIPLAMMYDAAVAGGVPLGDLPTSGEYAIPGDLQTLAQTMRSGETPSADMQRVALRDFGHMSSNFDKIGMSPEPGFERSIDWNDAGQAK